MIVRRRTWLYRLAGQTFAQMISFKQPVTASIASPSNFNCSRIVAIF